MRIVFTKAARDDVRVILDYITDYSDQGRRNVRERIFEKLAMIAEHPNSSPLVQSRRFRRVSVTPYPYVIYYRVSVDTIEVVGVRHGARRVPKAWR
jgi:plasmid stabilization system protein ParE